MKNNISKLIGGIACSSMLLVSCSSSVKKIVNNQFHKMDMSYELVHIADKCFLLDDNTATRPAYTSMVNNDKGGRIFTMLNKYNNSIYFYDYDSEHYLKKITYLREGPNAILENAGYYVKKKDSIYIFNRPMMELVLTDSIGNVKNRISLAGTGMNWPMYYPQYELKTVCPMMEYDNHLIIPGFSPFNVKDSLVSKFRLTASVDMSTNQINYHHLYPQELFGDNTNWDDPIYMQVFPLLLPSGDFIHSFRMSHELYLSRWDGGLIKKVYGGSNEVQSIESIDWDVTSGPVPEQKMAIHFLQHDWYGAVLYDSWRKTYYRFILKAIDNADHGVGLGEKNVAVIIMNDKFEYLGETIIGKGAEWNWENSFVTEEGLNIEYIDKNDEEEMYLNLRIFVPQMYSISTSEI